MGAQTRDQGAQRVCVLTIHRVVDDDQGQRDISPRALSDLLVRLVADGRLDAELDLGAAPRKSGCVLTFDDATADHFAVGEQLVAAGVRGIFYVPTGKIGEHEHMTERQLVSLADMGHVIGSHCVTHRRADRLSDRALGLELEASKSYLEDLLGQPVTALALPGGATTEAAPHLARQAGYGSLRLTRRGIYHSELQRWSIPCVPVTRFTLRRGSVTKAVRDLRLPVEMVLAERAKDLLPDAVIFRARDLLRRASRLTG